MSRLAIKVALPDDYAGPDQGRNFDRFTMSLASVLEDVFMGVPSGTVYNSEGSATGYFEVINE